MCTSPITITRNYPLIGTRQYVVPCGKCADCVRKKQSEFNALSLHQALVSGSLYMFTFTYNQYSVPVAISELVDGVPHIVGFARGCDWLSNNVLRLDDGSFRSMSLKREDVKLVLKQFRESCKKKGFPLSDGFKYAVFGEYGEQRGRPHYHGLFFGLSPIQAQELSLLWCSRFGFSHCGPVPGKHLTLDEIKKVSCYASKYISKGTYSRWEHILPYVEKPRRQSSLNFGSFSESELSALGSFMMGEMSSPFPGQDYLLLLSWIWSRLDAHLFPLLAKNFLFLKD